MRSFSRVTELGKRLAIHLGVAAAALSFSCGPPRYVPPEQVPSDPVSVLQGVQRREEHLRSIRARFKATAFYGAEESNVQGVLLVRKPDRFRMRLMLPLGITVLDVVSQEDRTWTFLPLAKDDESREARLFSAADVREAFQRGAAAFPGTCSATADSESVVDVTCRSCDQCPILRSIRLDRRLGTIIEETSYDSGQPRLSIRYDDYREVEATPLPFRVSLAYPRRNLSVEIEIREYEVNPDLKDDLFAPPRGAKSDKSTATLDPAAVFAQNVLSLGNLAHSSLSYARKRVSRWGGGDPCLGFPLSRE